MDYPSNSYKSKEAKKVAPKEEIEVKPVITGSTATKKKGSANKLSDVFVSKDAANVGEYLLMDILVPTLKKAALGALDMILNGGNLTSKERRGPLERTSYGRFYEDERRYSDRHETNNRFDYDDIVYDNRGDAERVLDEMRFMIGRYGYVRVSDMYDMSRRVAPYTGNKYGWTSLVNARVTRYRDGYVIDLPRAMPID